MGSRGRGRTRDVPTKRYMSPNAPQLNDSVTVAACRDENRSIRQGILPSNSMPSSNAGVLPSNAIQPPRPGAPFDASWCTYLEKCGVPETLIKNVHYAQFEEWQKQGCHKRGTGLFYSGYEDLPPRFQKKVREVIMKILDDMRRIGTGSTEDIANYLSEIFPEPAEVDGSSRSVEPLVIPEPQHTKQKDQSEPERKEGSSSRELSKKKRDSPKHKVRDCVLSREESIKLSSVNQKSHISKTKQQHESDRGNEKTGIHPNTQRSSEVKKSKANVSKHVVHEPSSQHVSSDSPSRTKQHYQRNKQREKLSSDAVECNQSSSSPTHSLEQCPRERYFPPSHYSESSIASGRESCSSPSIMDSSSCGRTSDTKRGAYSDPKLVSILDVINRKQNGVSGSEKKETKHRHHNRTPSPSSHCENSHAHEMRLHNRNRTSSKAFNDHASSSRFRKDRCDDPVAQSMESSDNEKKFSEKQSSSSRHSNASSRRGSMRRLDEDESSDADDCYLAKLTIEISGKVSDLCYWNNYLLSTLNLNEFLIEVGKKSRSLDVYFLKEKIAKQALYSLQKSMRSCSYITRVDPVVTVCDLSNKKVSLSVVSKCKKSIFEMYRETVEAHRGKVADMRRKLETVRKEHRSKKQSRSEEIDVLVDRIDSLESMEKVFVDYKNLLIRELMVLDGEPDELENTCKAISKDFSRECNSLRGALPIYSRKQDILRLIENNKVSILVAETGSGKSTQLIQYLWQAGFADRGTIVCTQPRKIAAVSICNYISSQMGSVPGELVGYATGVRLKMSNSTKLLYMTDYALLKRFRQSRLLDKISCVIVDEAHERSLFTDLLLGLLKDCIKVRKDLKVIITSATIDPTVFLDYFGLSESCVLRVPGRLFPVKVIWGVERSLDFRDHVMPCVECALDVHRENDAGGILVFLTSPAEAEAAAEEFLSRSRSSRQRQRYDPVVYTFHGRQDPAEQMEAFHPVERGCRKIIFSTNSAETSVTIPDIKYVIDCGLVREIQYDAEKKRSSLVLTFVNRSSAEQRKGRAGRTQPGVCYRLYSERNFQEDMAQNSIPEILRSSLQRVVLKIMEFNLDPEKFDFVESPPITSIRDAICSLEHLGSCKNGKLTELGKQMAKLPLEPPWAKLVLRGIEEGIGYEAVIVAALSSLTGRVQFRVEENKHDADQKILRFCDELGDFHTFLKIFFEWKSVERARSRWCSTNCINAKSMRSANQAVEDICEVLRNELHKCCKSNLTKPSHLFRSKFDPIIFECLSENLAIFSGNEKTGYFSPYLDDNFFIHPSSALCQLGSKSPQFLIYGTILKTSRSFLLNVAPVQESTIVNAYQDGKFEFQLDLLKRFQVVPKVIKPVGEIILVRYVLGKEGSKIKEIEKKIELAVRTSAFNVEVNPSKGQVILHMEQQYFRGACTVIKKAIEEGRAILMKEEVLCSTSAPFKFLLGCGGNITDVILPGESREILVEPKQSSKPLDVPKLLKKLEKYGSFSHQKSPDDSRQLSVTYDRVEYAIKALQALEGNAYSCSFKVHLSEMMDKDFPLFRICVSWCRLQCIGTGYIEFFDAADCIQASYILNLRPIYIGKQGIVVEPQSHEGTTLIMKKLPETAEEAEVMKALKVVLPSHVPVKGVKITRAKGSKPSPIDIALAKKNLQALFEPYMDSSKLIIELKKIEPNEAMWNAIVYVSDFKAGEKALKELEGKAKVGSREATLQAVFSCSLCCRRRVYMVTRKELNSKLIELKKRGLCTSYNIDDRRQDRDNTRINFTSKDIASLTIARSEISKLLKGIHIACSKDQKLLSLFSKREQLSFREVEKNSGAAIYCNPFRKTISIYGSKRACDLAEAEICCLSENSTLLKTKVYDLRDSDIPQGFLKAVYKEFGSNLFRLIRKYGLVDAYFNVQRHQLVVQGTLKKIAEVENHLEHICAELSKNLPQKKEARAKEEEKETCPVCFDEIGLDRVRLENCGHALCEPCFLLYMQADVFPVVCVQKECEKPVVLEDLQKAFARERELKGLFCKRALDHFIRENLDKVRYCLTPDCQMLYRVKSISRRFRCPECENDICTWCHSLYHHGMSCEMYQQCKVDEDYSLRAWMNENEESRKTCPKCSMAIEKDGGCNHVHCTSCGVHLCWLCRACFENSNEVYDHMTSCPLNVGRSDE